MELKVLNQTHTNPFSDELIVWLYNESLYTNVNLPSVVYLSVLAVLGFFGNSLILYIYNSKFKRTNAHIFIICLAVLDTICCFCMIMEIFDKRFPVYSGNYKVVCKIVRLAEMFSSVSSSTLLICIALDRYNKICKPFKRFSGAKKCLVYSVSLGVLLSWPMVLFHGPEPVHTGVLNVTGSECGDDENYKNSILPSIYFGLMGFLNILVIIVLSFFYIKIFRVVLAWKRKQFVKKVTKRSVISSVSMDYKHTYQSFNDVGQSQVNNSETNDYSEASNGSVFYQSGEKGEETREKACNGGGINPVDEHSGIEKSRRMSISDKHGDSSGYNNKGKHKIERNEARYSVHVGSGRKHMSRKSFKHYQTVTANTLLFSIVTVVYIFSYLPTIFVEILNAAHVYDDKALSNKTRSALIIMNLTYFLNNIANQYVYSAVNPAFRRQVKQLFTGP